MEIYKDATLPVAQRVEDLLTRMSLEEKVAQLQCIALSSNRKPTDSLSRFPHGIGEVGIFGGGPTARATMETNREIVDIVLKTPHAIPPIIHIEALTGLVGPQTTVYPTALGLAATFRPETVEEMGDNIRHQMVASGFRQALSPVMDVARDPRWGRVGESYGEDPTLSSIMSVAFVKGLQGEDVRKGVATTGKHFLGYGLTDGGLNMASSPIPHRELREVYAKPFQAAISEAGLMSVMNSYGSIDGELVIGSERILTGLLREEMGFEGPVVSDYMSIQHLPEHRVAEDMTEAAVMALRAGLDVECPYPAGYGNLIEAVGNGRIGEEYIDRSVRRVLKTKFELGLFEQPYPLEDWFEMAYSNPAYRAHSLKAAHESIVLLKNDGLLPIRKGVRKVAVVGPHANSLRLLFGCYTHPAVVEMELGRAKGEMAGMGGANNQRGEPEDDGFVQSEMMPGSDVLREHSLVTTAMEEMLRGKTPTILESIRAKCPDSEIVFAPGCEVAGNDRGGFAEAVNAARGADVAIITLGGKYGWGRNCTIGEGIDCDSIGLPGVQEELAKAIYETGTPCVLVHMDARPLSSPFIAENFPAIIENWFPGTTGGEALADVLFGDYNPAGRLPVTVARSAGQIPVYCGQKIGNSYFSDGMSMVLARYSGSQKTPLFYFGEGNSYTSFSYSNLVVDPQVDPHGSVHITFSVTNTGPVDGDEVAQLYISDRQASMLRPAMEFAGCKRLALKAGETKGVRFTLRADQFAFIGLDSNWLVEAGEMAVMAGGSSNDLPLRGSFNITATANIDSTARGFYAQAEVV